MSVANSSVSSPEKSSSIYSNIRSPSVASKTRSAAAALSDTFSLAHDADSEFTSVLSLVVCLYLVSVPVYDCREVEIDFSRDLDKLQTFPPWVEEIPPDSCLVVGYTVAVFKATASKQMTVSFNLQWIVVLGVPE